MTDRGNLVVDGLPSPELLMQRPSALIRSFRLSEKAGVAARLIGATALAGIALQRRGLVGLGAAATSAWLVRTALSRLARPAKHDRVVVEAAVTVDLDPERVLDLWSEPDALGRHLSHLRVTRDAPDEPDIVHLFAVGADGRALRWRAQRTSVPLETIVWRALDDKDGFSWRCELTVRPASGHRGAELHLRMIYGAGAGDLGRIASGATDTWDRSWSLTSDLRRFKQRMEAGEVATIDGQSRGPDRPRPVLPGRRALTEDHTPILEFDSATTAGGVR